MLNPATKKEIIEAINSMSEAGLFKSILSEMKMVDVNDEGDGLARDEEDEVKQNAPAAQEISGAEAWVGGLAAVVVTGLIVRLVGANAADSLAGSGHIDVETARSIAEFFISSAKNVDQTVRNQIIEVVKTVAMGSGAIAGTALTASAVKNLAAKAMSKIIKSNNKDEIESALQQAIEEKTDQNVSESVSPKSDFRLLIEKLEEIHN